jgi:hypothetical protein
MNDMNYCFVSFCLAFCDMFLSTSIRILLGDDVCLLPLPPVGKVPLDCGVFFFWIRLHITSDSDLA